MVPVGHWAISSRYFVVLEALQGIHKPGGRFRAVTAGRMGFSRNV
jgi:hypothetical protein